MARLRGYKFYRSPRRESWMRGVPWIRRPRVNESLLDYERENRSTGCGRGLIIHVDHENRRVWAKFFIPPDRAKRRDAFAYKRILDENENPLEEPYYDIFWDARDTERFMRVWVWNDWCIIDLNENSEASADEKIVRQFYDFDDLTWSSHKGGLGVWETRRYT